MTGSLGLSTHGWAAGKQTPKKAHSGPSLPPPVLALNRPLPASWLPAAVLTNPTTVAYLGQALAGFLGYGTPVSTQAA